MAKQPVFVRGTCIGEISLREPLTYIRFEVPV